ncbi:hypothetical protein M407DRAFT_23089 [Tulasnella calospora MUT 4182]|uniref:Uncharacterized protein n=1 Tax=Tulasnella calospora MUT 4182 TaxID=1051891 RepID=A0A0C3QLT2_9AGAM|nr:hypothetical protein M407DRAFT_23089 [Tulasnella calospora MUT 4182]
MADFNYSSAFEKDCGVGMGKTDNANVQRSLPAYGLSRSSGAKVSPTSLPAPSPQHRSSICAILPKFLRVDDDPQLYYFAMLCALQGMLAYFRH